LVEALVVGLGRVIRTTPFDAGDDRRAEDILGLQRFDQFAGNAGLLVILREYRRAILRPDIVALAIERVGIVDREEDFEDLAVPDAIGIEADPTHLGMAGSAGADFFVAGILDRASVLVRVYPQDAVEFQISGVEAPDAASAQTRDLRVHSTLLQWLLPATGTRAALGTLRPLRFCAGPVLAGNRDDRAGEYAGRSY